MSSPVKVAFASGTDDLNRRMIDQLRAILPELPLYVVSDVPPDDPDLKWIPYRLSQNFPDNLARCRAALRGKSIRLAAVMLVPSVPFRRMRLIALVLAPARFLAFNENLNHFMLRPRSVPAILRHATWRTRNLLRWAVQIARTTDTTRAPANLSRRLRPRWPGRRKKLAEELAANSGAVSISPGRAATGLPRILIASPYVPFPLSHGGAVRMFNLMRHAAADFDQVLVTFTDEPIIPPREILEICMEVVMVRRTGSHVMPSAGRPDIVEEFDSNIFRTALRRAILQHKPSVVQLEFTQMAQYAIDCAPAKTILVEHDITFDLFEQQLQLKDDWDIRRQLKLWRKFEIAAWDQVTRVVTMSEKDRGTVAGLTGSGSAIALPNGVDLERFAPSTSEPEPRRLLFIGSFGHLPNLIALEFFLNEVWPLLHNVTLHVIGGMRPDYFLQFHRHSVSLDLARPGIEVEGFVADVRAAYSRASVVIAPLLASAGTNIKILEAMAMGKATVSTPAGVNGLDLTPGKDILVIETPGEMAEAISKLLADPLRMRQLGAEARITVERTYGWESIARQAAKLYRELGNC